MASAVLTITADATSVNATLRGLERRATSVAASISAAFRGVDAALVRDMAAAATRVAQSYALIAKASRDAGAAGERAARRVRQVEEAEGSYRTSARRREVSDVEKAEQEMLRARQTAAREATQATLRELNRRGQAERAAARRRIELDREVRARTGEALGGIAWRGLAGAGRLAARGFGAATNVAGEILGQVDTAQRSRAAVAHVLNQALYQAGAGAGDVAPLHAMVFAHARQFGMDPAELAAGINAGQTEFSSLGNSRSSQAERAASLRGMLDTATFARNTGQDTGEVLRLSGMLQNGGVTGPALRQALLGFTGMAQRGAIELGGVTREAMQPVMQRMHQARTALLQQNPQATEAELAQAQGRAATTAFAEIEVARGQGQGARRFATSMAALGTELQGTHRQELLRGNIANARDLTADQRRQLLGMFQGNRLRAEFQSGLGFASRVNTVLGGNEALMRNIVAGGGHGNPMSLQSNWRNAVAAMMAGGGEVQRMIAGVGRDFTEEDVKRGAGLFGGEKQTTLQAQENERAQALASNTLAIQTLNTLLGAQAAHPVEMAAANQLGGLPAQIALANGFQPATGPRQLGYGEMAAARRAALSEASGGAFSGFMNVARGRLDVDSAGNVSGSDAGLRQRYETALKHQVALRGGDPNGQKIGITREAITDLVGAISRIQLAISPQDAAHAASGANASGGQRPPEAGR